MRDRGDKMEKKIGDSLQEESKRCRKMIENSCDGREGL